jgi:chromosome partitioning protein
MSDRRVIVIGNEKGGAGKSTVAVHLATALMHEGARVAVVDLDLRQQSFGHFFANRKAWAQAQGAELPHPAVLGPMGGEGDLDAAIATDADFVIIDTPGADTELSRAAHQRADLIVTPMNDSFVDFDVLGVIDPVTLNLVRPSVYAESVWDARKTRAAARGRSIDWVVLRNRLASVEARNRKRVDERLVALSRRVWFRTIAGLRDRVIYRELFPFGLTVADLGPGVRPVQVSLTHVAARQELRALMHELGVIAYNAHAAE